MSGLFEEEVEDSQGRLDAKDMLKSLFTIYDEDENGMDWS